MILQCARPLPEERELAREDGTLWFISQVELQLRGGGDELQVSHFIYEQYHLYCTRIESDLLIEFCNNGHLVDHLIYKRSRLRYTRAKDVGTRITSVEQRNARIIEIAKPLPKSNTLTARAIYWFVTTEQVEVVFDDTQLFEWSETVPLCDSNGATSYYLNRVNFRRNKQGTFWLRFVNNGEVMSVICSKTVNKQPKPNKRIKLSQASDESSKQSDQETDYVVQSPANNTNMPQYSESIPQHLKNHVQTPVQEPLIINILLLVPHESNIVNRVQKVLLKLKYDKAASSDNLHLYNQKQFDQIRHILIFLYKEVDATALQHMLPTANDVIALLERDKKEQPGYIMEVEKVNICAQGVNTTWKLNIKTFFEKATIDYLQLDPAFQTLFHIDKLEALLSGVSCQKDLSLEEFEKKLSTFIIHWSLKPPAVKELRQKIYLCFKYEHDSVRSFTDYAQTTLEALGLARRAFGTEPVTVNGCVQVYIRCPSYTLWYIMLNKKEIFSMLAEEGLQEIYECFISDVEASMKHPKNEKFMNELTHLQEQMISDKIAEQPTTNNRFRVVAETLHTVSTIADSNAAMTTPAVTNEGYTGPDRKKNCATLLRCLVTPLQFFYSTLQYLAASIAPAIIAVPKSAFVVQLKRIIYVLFAWSICVNLAGGNAFRLAVFVFILLFKPTTTHGLKICFFFVLVFSVINLWQAGPLLFYERISSVFWVLAGR